MMKYLTQVVSMDINIDKYYCILTNSSKKRYGLNTHFSQASSALAVPSSPS